MYDELVKQIHRQAVYLPEKFSKNAELLDVLMKAADAIEELNKPRWIPVTERLPEPDTNVLVKSGSFVSVWSLREDDVYWEDEYSYFHDMCEVTHWMPLPSAPTEE